QCAAAVGEDVDPLLGAAVEQRRSQVVRGVAEPGRVHRADQGVGHPQGDGDGVADAAERGTGDELLDGPAPLGVQGVREAADVAGHGGELRVQDGDVVGAGGGEVEQRVDEVVQVPREDGGDQLLQRRVPPHGLRLWEV